jgi:hypothetical protein
MQQTRTRTYFSAVQVLVSILLLGTVDLLHLTVPTYGQGLRVTMPAQLIGSADGVTNSTPPEIARLTVLTDGAVGVSSNCLFQWTSVANAEGYYLYVRTGGITHKYRYIFFHT